MPKPNGELSLREIERQDCVDSAIQEFIESMIPNLKQGLEWNIENIGLVRDALQEVIVDNLQLMTEQEFYPYLEVEL